MCVCLCVRTVSVCAWRVLAVTLLSHAVNNCGLWDGTLSAHGGPVTQAERSHRDANSVCVCVSKAKASHYVCHSRLETKRAPLPFLSSCERLSVHNETVEQCIEFLCNCLNYGIFLFIDRWGGGVESMQLG